MITITNKKIAGFKPQWAPYRGFSLLFDNPGSSFSLMNEATRKDWLKINCSVDEDKSLQLYKGFTEALTEIGEYLLTNTYLFCPSPPYSYHVTVWDGLNDDNIQNVCDDYRLEFENLLRSQLHSLITDEELTSEIYRSPLVTRKNWSIEFKFDELIKWGNQVLVARLKPVGKGSERGLKRIVEDRASLSAGFEQRFKVKMRTAYSPHVTLGYFANEEYAELATSKINHWTELIREKVDNLTISFSSISLYGFTDMATFFKRAERS